MKSLFRLFLVIVGYCFASTLTPLVSLNLALTSWAIIGTYFWILFGVALTFLATAGIGFILMYIGSKP